MKRFLRIFLITFWLGSAHLLVAQQPQTYEQTIKSANDRFVEKDYISAKTYYELALRLKPGDPVATKRLAETIDLIQKQMQEQEIFYKHLDQGDRLLKQGNEDEALVAYRKALQVFPNDRYVLGQVEKITRAREEMQRNQQAFTQAMQRGNAFAESERFEEAILQFQLALQLFPENAEAKAKLQQAELNMAQLRERETRFTQMMADARIQLNRKNYQEAKSKSQEALQLFPNSIEAQNLLSESEKLLDLSNRYEAMLALADKAYEAKQYTEARKLYEEARKIWPEQGLAADMIRRIDETLNSEAYRNEVLLNTLLTEANEAYSKQQLATALEKYNKILEINIEHPLAGQRVAEITFTLRQQQKQAEEQALFESLMAAGRDKETKSQWLEARNAYAQALEIRPNDATAQSKLRLMDDFLAEAAAEKERLQQYEVLMREGNDFVSQQNFEAALVAFEKALKIKPSDTQAASEKAKVERLLREAEANRAVEARYTSIIEEAGSFFDKGDYDRAEELYKEALKLKPNDSFSSNRLERIAETRKAMAQKRQQEQQIQGLLAVASEFIQNKRWKEAADKYEEVLNLDPNNATALAGKAEASIAMEREQKEALQRYDQSIAEADKQMGLNNYQDAIAAYKLALGYKPGDEYATNRIKQAEAIILERLNHLRNEYNKLIAEADRQFNARNFDRAIELYLSAETTKPDEGYPRQMIGRIAEIFEKNRVRELLTTAISIDANSIRRINFDPLDVADRRDSYVIIKARNLGKGSFPLLVRFGSNTSRNGSFVLPIPDNDIMNDFIVHIGAQYRWFSEENNWLEFIPENGNIEISLVRISKQ